MYIGYFKLNLKSVRGKEDGKNHPLAPHNTYISDHMTAVWAPRTIHPQILAKANRLFARQPIRLTDQFGYAAQLDSEKRSPLPELLFLGSTNVGKSSLLTSILKPPGALAASKQKPRDYPRASQRQGFTRTLSFFTVGRHLRLIDSPGYGYKSSMNQGSVIEKYLRESSEHVVCAWILVNAARGPTELDAQACALLRSHGIPFNFVVTKVDNIKHLDEMKLWDSFRQIYSELRAVQGDMYLTSVRTGQGMAQLRGSLYESSGLIEAASLN